MCTIKLGMRNLLDKADYRMIIVVEKLIEESSWVTVKQLATHVGSSPRTITYDLNIIKSSWGHILDMETSVNYGIKVNNKSTGVLSAIAKQIFRNSSPLNLLRNFFFHPWLTKDQHCEILSISSSSFVHYLKGIREILNHFSADVKIKKGQYYIKGENEIKLRIFFSNFIIERYDFFQPFLPKNRDVLLFLMPHLLPSEKVDFDNMDLEFIYNYTLLHISLTRENQGFVHGSLSENPIFDNEVLEKANEIYEHLNIKNLQNIYNFFNNNFYSWSSTYEEEETTLLIEALLEEFMDQVGINKQNASLPRMVEIMSTMYLISRFLDFKVSPLFSRYEYFGYDYRRNNEKVYNILKGLLEGLANKSHINLVNLLDTIIFWIVTYHPEFLSYQLQKQVLIVSDLGPSHYNMVSAQLEKRFNLEGRFIDIDCMSYEDIYEGDYSNYDLVITTFPIFNESCNKTIIVNDNINYEVLYHIEKILYEGN